MKTKILFTCISISLILVSAACSRQNSADEPEIGMPNPASVHCEEQGGQLEIRETDEGQIGICIFEDGSECEEWAFFKGECNPGNESAGGLQPGEKDLATMEVTAVYGQVVSPDAKGPADSILVLMPEGFGRVYVTGENSEIEEQIQAIKDKNEPGNKANFWGRLDCPSLDQCLLTVSQMLLDGPGELPEPDEIDGWTGTIHSGPPGPRSGGDDYFALSGEMPFEYGIWAEDVALSGQLEDLRDSGQMVRIWGELFAGRMDWNATQIVVTRIELID